MEYKITVLPGDGIGPEVVAQALKLIPVIEQKEDVTFSFQDGLIGASAIDQTGTALPEDTLEKCRNADAETLMQSCWEPWGIRNTIWTLPPRSGLNRDYWGSARHWVYSPISVR